jgi:hypothetical protein
MTNEIVKSEPKQEPLGTAIGKVRTLGPLVLKSHTVELQGKRYVMVSGATMVANALGYTVREVSVERKQFEPGLSGWEAVCEVVDIETGVAIGRGSGIVADDERPWGNRPQFARRAMASTRAAGRALRLSMGHLFGYLGDRVQSTTLEEMPVEAPERPSAPKPSPEPVPGYERLHVISVAQKKGKTKTFWVVTFGAEDEEVEALTFSETVAERLIASTGSKVNVRLVKKQKDDRTWLSIEEVI